MEVVGRSIDLDQWRHHTAMQCLIINDLKDSTLTVDKINQFGLRPPAFLQEFNKVGEYY